MSYFAKVRNCDSLRFGPCNIMWAFRWALFFFFLPEKQVIPKGFMEPLHRRVVTSKLISLLLRMRGVAQAFAICHCVEYFMGVAVICKEIVMVSGTSLKTSWIFIRLGAGRPSMGESRWEE